MLVRNDVVAVLTGSIFSCGFRNKQLHIASQHWQKGKTVDPPLILKYQAKRRHCVFEHVVLSAGSQRNG